MEMEAAEMDIRVVFLKIKKNKKKTKIELPYAQPKNFYILPQRHLYAWILMLVFKRYLGNEISLAVHQQTKQKWKYATYTKLNFIQM